MSLNCEKIKHLKDILEWIGLSEFCNKGQIGPNFNQIQLNKSKPSEWSRDQRNQNCRYRGQKRR